MSMPAESELLEQRYGQAADRDYAITDLAGADWAARKIQQARDRATEITLQYDEAIAEWTEAKKAALTKAGRDVEFLQHHLRLFLQHEVEADEDADPNVPVTIKLPCGGELAYRPNSNAVGALKVDNTEAVLNWVLENAPEAVSWNYDNKVVKAAILAGTEVPGAHIAEPNHEVWQIKVGK